MVQPVYAQITAGVVLEDSVVTNGEIDAIVSDSDYTYYGGNFTRIGNKTGPIGLLSTTTGDNVAQFPVISQGTSSYVNASVSDGNGGWFVAGAFSKIGGYARNGLAHIRSDGTVDAGWDAVVAGANSYLKSIALSGQYLYIAGGSFSSVGGVSLNNIARIDKDTAEVDGNWNPNVTGGNIDVILISGSSIYIGGGFTTVGGVARGCLAKLNDTTGALDESWTPVVTAAAAPEVYTMLIDEGYLYIGGALTGVNGTARGSGAKLLLTNGALDGSWNPGANDFIHCLMVLGSDIYVGGRFTTIGGQSRNYIAKLNKTNANADLTWDANASYFVYALATDELSIFAGGEFTQMHAQDRNKIARMNLTTGTNDASWDPRANGNVYTLVMDDTGLFVGGLFSLVGGQKTACIGRMDNATHQLDMDWNPVPPDPEGTSMAVYTLALGGDYLYVGGAFIIIDGAMEYDNIYRVDIADGTIDPSWDPDAYLSVRALAVYGSTIYAGGDFTSIGGQTLNRVAKLNDTTGAADPAWNPNAGNKVYALATDGTNIYAGGSFTTIGSQSLNRIAKLNNTNGNADPTWNPSAASTVQVIVLNGNDIYAGGAFTTIGGQPRNRIAKLNNTNGNADLAWNPNAGGTVRAISINGDYLYLGGLFTTMGGQNMSRVARVGLASGSVDLTWNTVTINNSVYAVSAIGSDVYFGGNFVTINTYAFPNAAHYGSEILYQLSNVSSDLEVFDSLDRSIKTGGYYGVNNAAEDVTLRKGDSIVGLVTIDLTADRDWVGVTADSSDAQYKAYVHGLDETVGFGGSYSLYIPQQFGDNGVGMCPGATTLAELTSDCTDLYYLKSGDPALSEVTVGGVAYWKVDGLTSTGGFSMYEEDGPTGSIAINSGDAYTADPDVILTIAATDDLTGVDDMMVSDDPLFDGASWEDYNTNKAFSFADGDGTKTIYVKFRDGWGNESATYSDTIVLDTEAPTPVSIDLDNDQVVTANPYVIEVEATDALSGITSVEFYVDGTLICTATQAVDGKYECNWDTSDSNSSVRIVISDGAGNTVEVTRSVTVDIDPLGRTGEMILLTFSIAAVCLAGCFIYVVLIKKTKKPKEPVKE